MENDDCVLCPLIDEEIEDIDCMENADAVRGILNEDTVPLKFKEKKNWKEICKGCRWHNY